MEFQETRPRSFDSRISVSRPVDDPPGKIDPRSIKPEEGGRPPSAFEPNPHRSLSFRRGDTRCARRRRVNCSRVSRHGSARRPNRNRFLAPRRNLSGHLAEIEQVRKSCIAGNVRGSCDFRPATRRIRPAAPSHPPSRRVSHFLSRFHPASFPYFFRFLGSPVTRARSTDPSSLQPGYLPQNSPPPFAPYRRNSPRTSPRAFAIIPTPVCEPPWSVQFFDSFPSPFTLRPWVRRALAPIARTQPRQVKG